MNNLKNTRCKRVIPLSTWRHRATAGNAGFPGNIRPSQKNWSNSPWSDTDASVCPEVAAEQSF